MADQEWQKRLNDSGYKNWLKVSLALIHSKEALHDFVEKVILTIHKRIKAKLGSGVCTKTSACNTKKGAPSCPSCSQWVKEIKDINGGMLTWKNANPHTWHNVPWEVAKCFMNKQGSKATAAGNTGPEKTDSSGLLNVLVNCKEFERNHLKDKNLPKNVRTVRNELMHSATMSFDDAEMQSKIDTIIALLEDEKELKNLSICQKKVKLIKSLRESKFQLKPEDEDLCIRTALKSPELSVESGVEIDGETMPLFDRLLKLIKENKDLKKKFEVKVNNIDEKLKNLKEETDARFLSFDFKFGELSGKVETLASLMEKFESGTSSSSPKSVLGAHEHSLFKNALQTYTQKKKLDFPKYDCTKGVDGKYLGTVFVQEQKFESKEPKPSKKAAEQGAAEVALRFLGSLDSEDDNDLKKSLSTVHQAMDSKSTQQKGKNYKNLLQEKAQMQRIPLPIYDVEQKESGFLCKVMYDGQWYLPEITPQGRKVDAQQKAAQFVLAVLDRGSFRVLCQKHAVKESETKVSDRTQPSFKNALQEYAQNRKLDQDLRYISIQDPPTQGYLSKVFLGRRCFKGKKLKAKMKEAEKHVAEIAMDILQGRCEKADRSCEKLLDLYHKELDLPMFPKYDDATCNDDGKFSVYVKVIKKYKIVCEDTKPNKKTVEKWLAEQAVKVLEEEKRMITGHENAKSRLNLFLQCQGTLSNLSYEVQCDQAAGFSGCLCFYAVDVFESLAPQPSKEEAHTSAAMSACNGMDLI